MLWWWLIPLTYVKHYCDTVRLDVDQCCPAYEGGTLIDYELDLIRKEMSRMSEL
jgi:cytoskeletal protein RodZ